MIDRRDFLRLAGVATTAIVAGCSSSRSGASTTSTAATTTTIETPTTVAESTIPDTTMPETTMPDTTMPDTTMPDTTGVPTTGVPTTSATSVETTVANATTTVADSVPSISVPTSLDDLAARLSGFLVRPADASYDATRYLQNTRFDDIHPVAVVVVAEPADVALAISFAVGQAMPFAVRSGGHSYGGWSSCPGLVIDVRGLAAITIDGTATTAQIGAGAALIDVYSTLAASGVAIAAGSCPTVGIAGLALGGGHGLTGRAFGLTCDQVSSVDIVTADGILHHCDANDDADLFWACRGGGGGSFGVVTGFTFDVHPVPPDATTYTLKYAWADAAAALAAWVAWVPGLPDNTTSLARLEGTPQLVIAGLHLGPADELNALLAPLSTATTSRNVTRRNYSDALLLEAGCSKLSVAQCHTDDITAGGTLARPTPFAASSHYYSQPLSSDAIQTAMTAIDDHRSSVGSRSATIQFDAYGGAINRIPADATAFVHRDAFCSAQYASFYSGSGDADRAWIRTTRAALQPFSNGEAYQNYADPELEDWSTAYYGANLARLQQIKRTVDPGNVFSFPQSIPLP